MVILIKVSKEKKNLLVFHFYSTSFSLFFLYIGMCRGRGRTFRWTFIIIFLILLSIYVLLLWKAYKIFKPPHPRMIPPGRNFSRVAFFVRPSEIEHPEEEIFQESACDKIAQMYDVTIFSKGQQFMYEEDFCHFEKIQQMESADEFGICKYFSPRASYFEFNFDYIVVIDPRITFKTLFNLVGSSIGLVMRSVDKIDRETFENDHDGTRIRDTYIYSSALFGASPVEFLYLCQNLTTEFDEGNFIQKLNLYFSQYMPKNILIGNLDSKSFAISYEVMDEEETFRQNFPQFFKNAELHRIVKEHRRETTNYSNSIANKYLAPNQLLLNNVKASFRNGHLAKNVGHCCFFQHVFFILNKNCSFFVQFVVVPFNESDFEHFSKQIRQLAVGFYLALTLDNIFHIDQKGSPMFGINGSTLYDVDAIFFKKQLEMATNKSKPIDVVENDLEWEWDLNWEAMGKNIVFERLRNNSVLNYQGTTWDGLFSLTNNEDLAPIIRYRLSNYWNDDYKTDLSLMISGGLKVIFDRIPSKFYSEYLPTTSNSGYKEMIGIDLSGLKKFKSDQKDAVLETVQEKMLHDSLKYKTFFLVLSDDCNYAMLGSFMQWLVQIFETSTAQCYEVNTNTGFKLWLAFSKVDKAYFISPSYIAETASFLGEYPAKVLELKEDKPKWKFHDHYNLYMSHV